MAKTDIKIRDVSAPASETNAGLVDTGAQTFAGDKTFTGNVAADNITDEAGSGAPDFPNGIQVNGLVNGKIRLIEQQSATSITNASTVDVNGNTLVVPAGTYMVDFGCKFHIQSSGIGGAGVSPTGALFITNTSNTSLSVFPGNASGEVETFGRGVDGGTDQYSGSFRRIVTITLGATTTVKLRGYMNDTVSGTGTTIRQINEAYMIWERIS